MREFCECQADANSAENEWDGNNSIGYSNGYEPAERGCRHAWKMRVEQNSPYARQPKQETTFGHPDHGVLRRPIPREQIHGHTARSQAKHCDRDRHEGEVIPHRDAENSRQQDLEHQRCQRG